MSINPLAHLKEQREERTQDLRLDLPVPTWDGDLFVRFNILPRKVVERFANKKRTVETDMDFIIQATREFYMKDSQRQVEGALRNDNDEDYVRVESGEGTATLWPGLAAAMDEPEVGANPHKVLMYCVKDNGLAVTGLAAKLITWMQNTDTEIAEALSGE